MHNVHECTQRRLEKSCLSEARASPERSLLMNFQEYVSDLMSYCQSGLLADWYLKIKLFASHNHVLNDIQFTIPKNASIIIEFNQVHIIIYVLVHEKS